jgi:zona occludens toxin
MSVVNLVTGGPGAGKSLFTLTEVKTQSEKENRNVFYHHIDGLKLPWSQLENVNEWINVPDGSIVVIDEAHKAFPVRGISQKIPLWVEFVGELRHRGITLWLITQSPHSLDVFVRDRVTRHYFLQRKLGAERATIYEDEQVLNTRSKWDLKGANKRIWVYPKKHYDWYKSAEIHTVKKTLPSGLWMIGLVVLGVVYAGYKVVNMSLLNGFGDVEQVADVAPDLPTAALSSLKSSNDKVSAFTVEGLQPVVEGRPWTAPAYTHLAVAKTFPRPQCVRNEVTGQCSCYSQQATRLAVTVPVCNALVDQGWFDPTKEEILQEKDSGKNDDRGPDPELQRHVAKVIVRGSDWF